MRALLNIVSCILFPYDIVCFPYPSFCHVIQSSINGKQEVGTVEWRRSKCVPPRQPKQFAAMHILLFCCEAGFSWILTWPIRGSVLQDQYSRWWDNQCKSGPTAFLVLHWVHLNKCTTGRGAPGLWCHLHWCRVEAWWCTGVRRCAAEYTGEQPAPSAASKAGAARG